MALQKLKLSLSLILALGALAVSLNAGSALTQQTNAVKEKVIGINETTEQLINIEIMLGSTKIKNKNFKISD